MCKQLQQIRDSLRAFGGGFDPSLLGVADADQVVILCSQIESSAAAVKALAATRVADTKVWQTDGYRSAEDKLARETGMSPGRARRLLRTGRRMSSQADVSRAALSGELTAEQAELIADGVEADPDKAAELLEGAKTLSNPELVEVVSRVKAANTDLDERHRRLRARRSLRRWSDTDGAGHAHLFGVPEELARVWRVLDPIRRRLIMLGREKQQPNEPLDALDYDALMTLFATALGDDGGDLSLADLCDLGLFPQCSDDRPSSTSAPAPEPGPPPGTPSSPQPLIPGSVAPAPSSNRPTRRPKKLAGSPAVIFAHLDLDAFWRGIPLEGELCEIPGYGQVPVRVLDALAANGNTKLVTVLTKAEQVVGVFRHRRRPNAHQRSALDYLYPTCAARGCTARAGLQSDHRKDWAKTHYTAVDLLDRLCAHHHDLKTYHGWSLTEGIGKRPFVPPTDPRHPERPPDGRSPPGDDGTSASPAQPSPKEGPSTDPLLPVTTSSLTTE